jgi:hypothetical protein
MFHILTSAAAPVSARLDRGAQPTTCLFITAPVSAWLTGARNNQSPTY